jgi:hypothetical protein
MSVRRLGPLVRRARVGPTVTSVKDLIAAISNFIDGWNDRCHPFVWTKPPTRSSQRHPE